MTPPMLLDINDLTIKAALPGREIDLLRDVDIHVAAGQVLGVVGESGSGKTTLARSVIGLLERNVRVAHGSIELAGATIMAPNADRTVEVRGSQVGMVFQDASRALNPLMRVRTHLAEVQRRHDRALSKDDIAERSATVLRRMRIDDPERVLNSYPHQLSGGLRQRVAIALAVVTEPALVIADECTTALDVTTQTEVIALFRQLVDELSIGLLFVTHDIMLASDLCDQIAVMSQGEVVERGPTDDVLLRPKHDYTRRLLSAVPSWTQGDPAPHV